MNSPRELKAVILDTSPKARKAEGYWLRFPEPEPIEKAIAKFRKQRPACTRDESLVAFALEELRIQLRDAKEMRRLLAGEPVFLVLSTAIRTLLPKILFEWVINPKYLVRFLDIAEIRTRYAGYVIDNPKIGTFKLPKYFTTEVLGGPVKGPEALERLFAGELVANRFADAVLKLWPNTPFEVVVGKPGPRPNSKLALRGTQISLLKEMQRDGARIGFIPLGAADRFLLGILKARLAHAKISIKEIQYIAPRDVGRRDSEHLHFIVNATPPSFNSPEVTILSRLYSVPIALFISASAVKNEVLSEWGANSRIAVVEDSPEEVLGRALHLDNLVRISGKEPASEVGFVAEMMARGGCDAALVNLYSFQRPLDLESLAAGSIKIAPPFATSELASTYNSNFNGWRFFPAHAFFSNEGRTLLDPWKAVLRKIYPGNMWRVIVAIVSHHRADGLANIFDGMGSQVWRCLHDSTESEMSEEEQIEMLYSGTALAFMGHIEFNDRENSLPASSFHLDLNSLPHFRTEIPATLSSSLYLERNAT